MIVNVETKEMEDRAQAVSLAMIDAISDMGQIMGCSPMEAVAGAAYALLAAMEASPEADELVRAVFACRGRPIHAEAWQ